MVEFEHKELFSNYKKKKIDQLNELEKLSLPTFKTLEIECNVLDKVLQDKLTEELTKNGITDTSRVIYFFTVVNGCQNKIQEAVKQRKNKYKRTSKHFIPLPKVNELSGGECNNVLYVGKTNSKFLNRFKQHLGLDSSKTYALHLNVWAKELTVALNYGIVDLEQNKIELLEELENILHDHLKPILGRSGH